MYDKRWLKMIFMKQLLPAMIVVLGCIATSLFAKNSESGSASHSFKGRVKKME